MMLDSMTVGAENDALLDFVKDALLAVALGCHRIRVQPFLGRLKVVKVKSAAVKEPTAGTFLLQRV